jgi:Ca-activated chloride channel family protein
VSDLAFGAPAYLVVLLLLLPVAIWVLVREQRRQRDTLGRFGEESLLEQSSPLPSRARRAGAAALRLGAVALLLLALARPQLGERGAGIAHSGRDLLVLLDLSRSMNAADTGVTRLSMAKQTVAHLLAASPHNRVGLIVFGGSAFLQLPLTTNYAAFQRFLSAASTDDLGDPGTDLSSALVAAATTFEHEGERGYQSVLLLSDGESGPGEIGPAVNRLSRAHIPVFVVGIGSRQGSPVPADSSEAPERWHRDHIGRIVMSRLEEGDLRRAARETNGMYQQWSPSAAQSLALELARASRRRIAAGDSLERVDRFQWPLGLALVFLSLEPLIPMLPRRRRVR